MSHHHICCQHFHCENQEEDVCEDGLDTQECKAFFDNGKQDPNDLCPSPSTAVPPPQQINQQTEEVMPPGL